jgi:hypothetical protein
MNNGAAPPALPAPQANNLPPPPPIQAQQAIGNAIPQVGGLVIQIPQQPFNFNADPNMMAPLPNQEPANGQVPNFQAHLNAIQIGEPGEPQGPWIFPQLAPQPANQGPHNPAYAFIHGMAQGQGQAMQINNNANMQPAQGPIPMNINDEGPVQEGARRRRRRKSRRGRSRRGRSSRGRSRRN